MAVGVLVYGDNHLILRGPAPTGEQARQLAAHFGLTVAQIRPPAQGPGEWEQWRISTREFREDLEWAAVLPAPTSPSETVQQLLAELYARNVKEISCAY